MIFTSDIPRYKNTRFSILREDFLAFCEGKRCASMIISYFEYWHKVKENEVFKLCQEQDDYEPKESDYYQHQSIKEIVDGILGEYQRESISDAIDYLVDKKMLRIIEEARHNQNKSRTYLFTPQPLIDYINNDFSPRSRFFDNGSNKKNLDGRDRFFDTTNIKDLKQDAKASQGAVAPPPVLLRRKPVDQQVETNKTPTLLRRKPSLYPSKDVETLFNHWNDVSITGTTSYNPAFASFQLCVNNLVKALKKHSVETIKKAMSDYHRLISFHNSLLKKAAPGHHVKLQEFFAFGDFTTKRMVNSAVNQSTDIMEDVDSWFEECLNGWEYLHKKFDKQPEYKDANPEVTKEIARVYRARVNPREFTPNEIQQLITAARKLVDYHNSMKDKLKFNHSSAEQESARAFAHHIVDAIVETTQDVKKIDVSWICSENHFLKRMPEHFKRVGMLSIDHQATKNDMVTPEMKAACKAEVHAAKEPWKEKCRNNPIDLSLPEKEIKKLRYAQYKELEDIENAVRAKYGLSAISHTDNYK